MSGTDSGTEVANLLPAVGSGEWRSRSPREDVAPVVTVEGADVVAVAGVAAASFGSWTVEVTGLGGPEAYAFEVDYQAEAVASELVSVCVVVTWARPDKSWIRRDYVDDRAELADGWRRLSRTLVVPAGATRITVDLIFRWSAGGRVRWRRPVCAAAQKPGRRGVRVATSYVNPNTPTRGDVDANLRQLLEVIDDAGRQGADIVCLPETMLHRNSGLGVDEAARSLPNEWSDALGAAARRHRTYVVATFHERTRHGVHVTALLIDRAGHVAGRYRKTHLSLIEAENGAAPGAEYPVFRTDFGVVGMLICWDHWFPEPARLLRLKGAEIVFIPSAGDARIQSLARAVDNGMFVVVAGVNGTRPSRIIDPSGEVLGELAGCDDGNERDLTCLVDIDLNRTYDQWWFSVGPADAHASRVLVKERRPDTYDGLLRETH